MSPVAEHNWPLGCLDIVVVAADLNTSPPPYSINILFRFTTIYPWPVGLVSHYILHPSSEIGITYQWPPQFKQHIPCSTEHFGDDGLAVGDYGRLICCDSTHGRNLVSIDLRSQPQRIQYIHTIEGASVRSLQIDEARGRVVLGDENGEITVLDYV